MKPLIFVFGERESFENYARALEAAGARPRFSPDPRAAEDCAGLLLPGGGDLDPRLYGRVNTASEAPDPARDRTELALARRFLCAGRPILGICRGLQVLNVALGGTLVQDLPGHSRLNGGDRLHPVCALRGSRMERLYGGRFTVNSAHHQAVELPGRELRVTLRADDGTAEALEHGTLPVLGVQWHPERLTGAVPGTADGALLFSVFCAECRGISR